jgi:hypothetical protein
MTTPKFLSLYVVVAPIGAQFVARTITPKFWSVYALVAPAVGQSALLATQYLMFRRHVIDQIRARAEAQSA